MKGSKNYLGMNSPEKGRIGPTFVTYFLCVRDFAAQFFFSTYYQYLEMKKLEVRKIGVSYMTMDKLMAELIISEVRTVGLNILFPSLLTVIGYIFLRQI